LLICLLTPLGIIVIGRSIPASHASIPEERAASTHGIALSEDAYAKEPKAHLSVARGTMAPPNRTRCPGCGVIQSIREIQRARDDAISQKTFEITVRFRDGDTTVFTEATPRTWKTGNRVIVIARANAAHN